MRIFNIIRTFNRWAYYAALVPIVGATLLTIVDVTGRYFRNPVVGSINMGALALTLIIALSLAHTQAVKGHIAVDIVFDFFPRRAKIITTFITTVLSLGILIVMAWRQWPYMLRAISGQEWVPIVGWPMWPFKGIMAVGLSLLALQLVTDVFDTFKQMIHPEQQVEEAHPQDLSGLT
jgi:TRAP-type C4-dicarboxylate transport system permease small subunit